MTTLAVITSQLESICDLIDESGTIPEDLLERFADAKLQHADKVGAYVAVIKGLQHNAAYYSSRAEELSKRAKTCERLEKAIKERLMFHVQQSPSLPWKSEEGDKISVRDNPESLVINLQTSKRSFSNILNSVADIPHEDVMQFIDVTEVVSLNTAKVKEHLQKGETLAWARLERWQHLRLT